MKVNEGWKLIYLFHAECLMGLLIFTAYELYDIWQYGYGSQSSVMDRDV